MKLNAKGNIEGYHRGSKKRKLKKVGKNYLDYLKASNDPANKEMAKKVEKGFSLDHGNWS